MGVLTPTTCGSAVTNGLRRFMGVDKGKQQSESHNNNSLSAGNGGGGGAQQHGLFTATRPSLFMGGFFSSKGKSTRGGGSTSSSSLGESILNQAAEGMGGPGVGQPLASIGGDDGQTGGQLPAQNTFFSGTPGATVPKDDIDDILMERAAHLTGPRRRPVSYDIAVKKAARAKEAKEAREQARLEKLFDEFNMPREAQNPNRKLEFWEFKPDEDHKALVLLLYRNVLKGLMNFKSVRRRSILAYARFAFRRRANATEKLLIDECIEEARRAIYVLEKHHRFTETREFEFDTMTMPKDTGQDVKTYMEEHYDPEVSRMQFQNFTDVQPGKEHLHRQNLGPTSGEHHWKDQKSSTGYKIEIRDEDKVLRPPPPPNMGLGQKGVK